MNNNIPPTATQNDNEMNSTNADTVTTPVNTQDQQQTGSGTNQGGYTYGNFQGPNYDNQAGGMMYPPMMLPWYNLQGQGNYGQPLGQNPFYMTPQGAYGGRGGRGRGQLTNSNRGGRGGGRGGGGMNRPPPQPQLTPQQLEQIQPKMEPNEVVGIFEHHDITKNTLNGIYKALKEERKSGGQPINAIRASNDKAYRDGN